MLKVSVIIPVFNTEKYLRQCLDSIMNQTLEEIEVICVDDGSTDSSSKILSEYAARDSRVKLVETRGHGTGAARNAGMEAASGTYLFFMDSDDFCFANMLERLYETAEQAKADLVIAGFMRYDSTGMNRLSRSLFGEAVADVAKVFGPLEIPDRIFTAFLPAPWNKFFRREFVRDQGLRFQEIKRCNDVCFTQLALACAERLTVLEDAFYCYRQNRAGSLQSELPLDPITVCEAYLALKRALEGKGLFETFSRSFARAAFSSCIRCVDMLRGEKEVGRFLHWVRNDYRELFSEVLGEGDFRGDEAEYCRYANFMAAENSAQLLAGEAGWAFDRLGQANERLRKIRQELNAATKLISAKDLRIDDLESRVKKWTAETVKRNQLITAKDARIDDLESRVKKWTAETVKRNQLITAKDARIDDLEARGKKWLAETVRLNQELSRLRSSRSYRLGVAMTWPFRMMKQMLHGGG